uniref:Uncharacterized protein n=1 Tax=Romanomermis culicivorax TaxID=13658 RepID=A0A915J8P5_ROMCU
MTYRQLISVAKKENYEKRESIKNEDRCSAVRQIINRWKRCRGTVTGQCVWVIQLKDISFVDVDDVLVDEEDDDDDEEDEELEDEELEDEELEELLLLLLLLLLSEDGDLSHLVSSFLFFLPLFFFLSLFSSHFSEDEDEDDELV